MKIQLKRDLIEQIKISTEFQVKELTTVGKELDDNLNYCLSKFTEGILDPDIAGKSPNKFISNLQRGLLGDFSKKYIITAQDQNDTIGILIGIPKEEKLLHIYSLHVSPNYRNKGVGSALLSKCINDAYFNNIKGIILDVHIDNKPAYNLYKKFGFKEV